MKKTKRILITLLALMACVCFSVSIIACAPTNNTGSETTYLRVYSNNYTVNVGSKIKIDVSYDGQETVRFSSLNTAVATVDANGTVTGVADGMTTVKVVVGDQIIECRINVVSPVYSVNIGAEETVVFVGSDKNFNAEALLGGKEYDCEILWTVSDQQNCTLTIDGNNANFKANVVGDYVVTAKSDKAETSCSIKVVEKNAKRLDSANLSVDKCKTLSWQAIDGTVNYAVSVNFGEWEVLDNTTCTFDVSSYTENLDVNEDIVLSVKALATKDYNKIDSLPTTINFKHAFVGVETTEATCLVEGVIEYTCSDCDKKIVDNHYIEAHEYKVGVCSKCKGYQTEGVAYKWDDEKKCYYLSHVTDQSLEVLYIAGSYNDGINGEAPVTYIKALALSGNGTIKHVIVPESITKFYSNSFMDMLALKSVTFQGDIFISGDPNNENYTGLNHFLNSYNIESLIVKKSFVSEKQSFIHNRKKQIGIGNMSIYAMEIGGKINLAGNDYNKDYGLCNGNVYYMDETGVLCNSWRFAENGYEIEFNDTNHNFVKDVCVHCGAYDNYGINYAFDSEKQCYYVAQNSGFTGSVAKVVPVYNDGLTGVYPVKYVSGGAFANNHNIKVVILPESVDNIGGNAFFQMDNLETIIMPGVELIQSGGVHGTNHIVRVKSLRNLVVKKNFVAEGSSQIFRNDVDGTPTEMMSVYAMEKGGKISIGGARQNLFSGRIFYFNADLSDCACWRFAEDGYTIEVGSTDHKYSLETGLCESCGDPIKTFEKDGLVYNLSEDQTSYVVSEYKGNSTEINVPATVFNKPVTQFNAWIQNNTVLKKVVLPKSVTHMAGAFFDCSALETVIMPGVVTFGTNTFYKDISLSVVVLAPNAKITRKVFMVEGYPDYVPKVDIYVLGSAGSITVSEEGNGLLSGNYYSYSQMDCLNTWKYDDDGNIVKSTKTELCDDCKAMQEQGFTLALTEDGQGYAITACNDKIEEIVVPATYHGLPVTQFNAGISNNDTIKKLVLPESVTHFGGAFFNCSALETVIMPGVVTFGGPNVFYKAINLSVVVVNPKVNISRKVFMVEGFPDYVPKADLFVVGSVEGITVNAEGNGLLTGNYFYYSEIDCLNTWRYDENGDIVKSTELCDACKATEEQGLVFTLNEDGQSYSVTACNDKIEEIVVPATCHGKPVTQFNVAIYNNTTIKKLVLPKSVTHFGGAFFDCSALETVIMPGVVTFGGTNTFYKDISLSVVVLAPNAKITRKVFMVEGYPDYVAKADIYVDGSSHNITVSAEGNGLLTGNYFYYSETRPTDEAQLATTWCYVDGVPTLWSKVQVEA